MFNELNKYKKEVKREKREETIRDVIYRELDMLNGNISRLSVSDDKEEILKQVSYINLRVSKIYGLRIEEINKQGK